MTAWAGLCRLVRAETLKQREVAYVRAAQAFGVGHRGRLRRGAAGLSVLQDCNDISEDLQPVRLDLSLRILENRPLCENKSFLINGLEAL